MTDQLQPVPPPAYPINDPPPAAPPAKQGSKLVPIIVLAVIFGFLGFVLWQVKDAGSADDLKVGECFDIPTSSSFSTVTKVACTAPHDAEVFHVTETDSSVTSPITFALDRFVAGACGPAYTAYVGAALEDTPELSYGYFYPTFDGWDEGDRTITCYVTNEDDSKLSKSLKGSAGS